MHLDLLDQLSPKDFIIIRGAKMHNLKNISLAIPRNQLVVVTGLSGSGKSSLVLDTLFVEAQRMYIESVSAYARQFLGKMEKPLVDAIQGLSPAIAIQQNVSGKNPRSTVGTLTELCDYLHLLYARIGTTYSPISGQKVKKDSVSDVVDYIQQQPDGTKALILYPITVADQATLLEKLRVEQGKGFTRVMQGGLLFYIEELLAGEKVLSLDQPIYGLVDRIIVKKSDQNNQYRIADSVQVAFFEGHAVVELVGVGQQSFSDRFELDGISFVFPTVSFFNFNTPYGACKSCSGLGQLMGIDPNKVIPNPALSLVEGAIAPWNGPAMSKWLAPLLAAHQTLGFPIYTPYSSLTFDQQQFLWRGNRDFIGIDRFFDFCATQTDKIHYRVLLSRYRSKTTCIACRGSRMRPDAHYVKIDNHSIVDLLLMPIHDLVAFFDRLSLTDREAAIAQRVVVEIKNRLRYLAQVGLGYLTLSRPIATLSGGEHQRIKLATALGSPLFGTIYILDEPTIGLHPRDTDRLVQLLLDLNNQGNTVIVVEHEELVMRAADSLIEIGPEAGAGGGRLVFQGTFQALQQATTHTARYLNGCAAIPLPNRRRPWRNRLFIKEASLHNLKQVSVTIPLNVLTVVTGVSGSGKSTLIKEVLYPALVQYLANPSAGVDTLLSGDLAAIQAVELVHQHPLGKSSRSNPATYLGIYDPIRDLFAQTDLARSRRYQAGHFSFNSEKGQCPACRGEGQCKIEMQFMADIYLPCGRCKGSRFKPEIADVTYCGKNISQVLGMTVDEAFVFFADQVAVEPQAIGDEESLGEAQSSTAAYTDVCEERRQDSTPKLPLEIAFRTRAILHKLKVLQQVGLGYIPLGQSSSSLSGGEGQRLKLAYYLEKELADYPILFIFDEPTTGLHMHDVARWLQAINGLIDQGHSVVVIEHHIDVIKSADWLIDLGPDGGQQGGKVVFTGTPEALVEQKENYTAQYLKEKI
ncbi:MAG: excinuclease ABC subunit UvrA [Candidatus Cardinium sp.]|uniref:excinuclease ABC subunit UvrA n=1 Tax=Cardinium endosymbiont of Dermatophagoides farinae TaxID=2597823 RepID=UPI001CB8A6A4|nr:excinuclease ABC subunit UvrA [Cardinium endosymbiont of Dermatophagoides farinae]UWW97079.1 MAG: excinuclease ABC subunit UvrA [Candidatus Cardinium sp.]